MNYRPPSPGRVPGFSFENMLIGIVVNVMNAENEKLMGAQAEEEHEPTLRDIHEQRARLERDGRLAAMLAPAPGRRRGARQALLNGDSLIATTAAIGTSSPSSIAVIISQPSSL